MWWNACDSISITQQQLGLRSFNSNIGNLLMKLNPGIYPLQRCCITWDWDQLIMIDDDWLFWNSVVKDDERFKCKSDEEDVESLSCESVEDDNELLIYNSFIVWEVDLKEI